MRSALATVLLGSHAADLTVSTASRLLTLQLSEIFLPSCLEEKSEGYPTIQGQRVDSGGLIRVLTYHDEASPMPHAVFGPPLS